MLDVETKSRINTARDILVGKVPDPKSQVEQITIALIYKFMDDMDVESEELGGKRTFFTGEYAKYAWRKIFDPRQSGYDLLNLYSEAIAKMDVNPGIPKLFRDIFKNAYLPYRDPETLKSFLKVINEFDYSHSEKLGDAFEFLLSILGSQGEAGQFRTPRHIIDFMVEIVDPKKNETILDPACGTAGFLISSYKHIIKHNSSIYKVEKIRETNTNGNQTVNDLILSNNGYTGDKLSAEERRVLADNMHGYDISPDMVRLSLVNMYLHGVKEPHISEYDTLTSEDNWNHYSDVILANPPFMSPKGGIKPHKRFSVQSNRSEVLFVDYIAEHLTREGRAAVIVPEGIIFQSGNAYKQLRKMLVEKYLMGVISLPAGVFQPYSGVKTSILWLDKSLVKKTDKILFIKVENDGFDLGAQRRSIKDNDLPFALESINTFISGIHTKFDVSKYLFTVNRKKLAVEGDYNLSAERYRLTPASATKYSLFRLEDIFDIKRGGSPRPIQDFITESDKGINWIKIGDAREGSKYILQTEEKIKPEGVKKSRMVQPGDFILSNSMSFGRPYIMGISGCIHDGWLVLKPKSDAINKDYIYYILGSDKVKMQFEKAATGGVVRNLNIDLVREVSIPVPSFDEQIGIVAELESYQKIIDGARMVVENYKPRIEIDPEWEMVELGDVCDFVRGPFGGSLKKEIFKEDGVAVYEQSHAINNSFEDVRYFIDEEKFQEMKRFEVLPGDLLMSCSGTMGKLAIAPHNIRRGIINQALLKLTPMKLVDVKFLRFWMESENFQNSLKSNVYGAAIQNVASVKVLQALQLPLPALKIQKEIVFKIEQELSLINSSINLMDLFSQKIKDRIAKVWGK